MSAKKSIRQSYRYDKRQPDTDKQGVYTQLCECGRIATVKTQAEETTPAYHTTVFTYCTCGNELQWDLPVN